jgi:hypothetical protein
MEPSDIMNDEELHAIAGFLLSAHGSHAFQAALERARSLSVNGELGTASVWQRIAEEVSEMETGAALKRLQQS